VSLPDLPFGPGKKTHPYAWLWEPLQEEASFLLRPMFGAKMAYLHGKAMLCFMAKEDPWRGLLVCTEQRHHPALSTAFPGLVPHSVLGKWLYLPESNEDFETIAEKIVQAVLYRDFRIGVIPPPKKRRKGKKKPTSGAAGMGKSRRV